MHEELPDLCGAESLVEATMAAPAPDLTGAINFCTVRSAHAIALHMHQPLIPAGTDDLTTAPVISNLRHMMEHPEIPDSHNAPVFKWCYQRMAQFIPQLLRDGHRPRVMLDYSGCLFHGLAQMGAHDVLDDLRSLTTDPASADCVEWLGTTWGHAVAPSTPVQDFRLHVRAWQHHFASIFGHAALARVRGFSPAEMALPNHPDVAYAFVKTLVDCGYQWVLVQEHSVEQPDGSPVGRPHVPHRLVVRNSRGETAAITAIVKTQGSDTKLVAQMQPYHEAKTLSRIPITSFSRPARGPGPIAPDVTIPPLVTQIGDGENGGVMMNEFPPMFLQTTAQSSGTATPPMNVSEYLQHLAAAGLRSEDFPTIQPVQQHQIWQQIDPGQGPEKLEAAIATLRQLNPRFHVEGGSWTADKSWTRGYENVLTPMQSTSRLFHEKAAHLPTTDLRYKDALYHLLMTQCSCYRYWGQGRWTDYARELCRRAQAILEG